MAAGDMFVFYFFTGLNLSLLGSSDTLSGFKLDSIWWAILQAVAGVRKLLDPSFEPSAAWHSLPDIVPSQIDKWAEGVFIYALPDPEQVI